MQQLSTRATLDAWELAGAASPAERPFALMASFAQGVSEDELRDLSVGACNATLLRIHEALFGSQLNARAVCPACGEQLGLSASVSDVAASAEQRAELPMGEVECAGYAVAFRVPTGRDIEAIARCASLDEARQSLVCRCVSSASRDGAAMTTSALPEEVIGKVEEAMALMDPYADMRFDLTCTRCSHGWTVSLDASTFLWTEIQVAARRVLGEVQALASRYGWSEADILEMSPRRRHAYLQGEGV